MGRVVIGGRRLPLKDFVDICVHRDSVVLDPAMLSQIEANMSRISSPAFSLPTPVPAAELFSDVISRACVSQLLVRLLHGKYQVRSKTILSICDLLNRDRLQLDKLNTIDSIISESGARSDITNAEYATLTATIDLPLAMALCSAFAIMRLMSWADLVAALTLEGCSAHVDPLAPLHHEEARPHAGQLQSANNLRTLLKGSSFAGQSGRNVPDPISIRCVPQYHGPIYDIVKNASRTLSIEINSAQQTVIDSVGGKFHAQPLSTALSMLLSAAALVASGSAARIDEMVESSVKLGLPKPDVSAVDLREAASEASRSLQDIIANVAPLASNIATSDSSKTCALIAEKFVAAEIQLKRVLEIETNLSMVALQQRITNAQSEFEAGEETRRSRMETVLAEVQAKLEANPNDKRLLAQARGLEYKPKPFSISLGSGTGAIIAEFKQCSPLQCLKPYDATMAALVECLLTSSNEGKKPKRPKGTRDFGREDMMVRERVFSAVRGVFQAHGATGIDTPVFELKETLMGKYGEDSKLIYDLADQGGEQLSLRYDLTVPLARYIASNNVGHIKRYHIARVYRRDNPAMNRGRFREFYQCDFDIAGSYDVMIPDAEAITVMCEILCALNLNFQVKFSHRVLLDAIMEVCQVPPHKFRTICSAIDKLDKESWETVRDEMLQKGLDGDAADRLEVFVKINGEPFSILATLRQMPALLNHKKAVSTLNDLQTLFEYLKAYNALQYISFDLSLARGLDYYTGVIFESVLTDTDQVGSIAAGGRYDTLVGMFLPSNKQIPAVGVSIGIERIFTIIQERERQKKGGIQQTYTQVMVASVGGDLTLERMAICAELWKGGICAEMIQKRNPYFDKQLEYTLDMKIPFLVIIGQNEIDEGTVKVKNTASEVQEVVVRSELVETLRRSLANLPQPQ